jgi:uncharacterized membrane protein
VSTPQGTDRLVLFTDAVVAIAITVLVLPLVDAVSEAEDAGESSIEVVTGNLPGIFSFLLSFAVIARLWLVHHRLFGRVEVATRGMMLWNLAWILTIVVLPFPTEMTGTYGDDRFTVALYIGTILASSACLTALSVLVNGRLVAPAASATALLAVALLLVLLVPAVGYFALLLLFLGGLVERAWLRVRPDAAAP